MGIDYKIAGPTEIMAALKQKLAGASLTSVERAQSLDGAHAAVGLWCFLRDDEQVASTAECLADFARFSGFSNVAHHLKRRDIPRELIDEARRVFTRDGRPNELAAAWDGDLHSRVFVPFVLNR